MRMWWKRIAVLLERRASGRAGRAACRDSARGVRSTSLGHVPPARDAVHRVLGEDEADDRRGLDDRPLVARRAGRVARRGGPGWSAARPRGRCQARQRHPSVLDTVMQPLVDEHRDQLLDEERVALGRLDDAGADALGEPGLRRAGARRSRLAAPPRPRARASSRGVRSAGRPVRAALEQLVPRRAEHERCGASSARRPARCSTRSRNVGSAQWMSSKTTDERPRRAPAPPGSAGRPRRAPRAGGHRRDSPIAEATRARRLVRRPRAPRASQRRLGRSRRSTIARRLADGLGERPERDAVAVGQAATAEDRAPRPRRARNSPTSRDLPTPASPTTVTSMQRRVARRTSSSEPRSRVELLARGRRSGESWRRAGPLDAGVHAEEAIRRHGLRLALELERLDGLDVDGVAHEPVA